MDLCNIITKSLAFPTACLIWEGRNGYGDGRLRDTTRTVRHDDEHPTQGSVLGRYSLGSGVLHTFLLHSYDTITDHDLEPLGQCWLGWVDTFMQWQLSGQQFPTPRALDETVLTLERPCGRVKRSRTHRHSTFDMAVCISHLAF